MMRLKRLHWIALVSVILLVLSACGGSEGSDTTPATADVTTTASTGGSDTSDGDTEASEDVTIEFWQPDNREAWLDALGYVVETFESDNPGVTVNVVEVPWGDMNTKVQASMATDTLPDLVYGWAGMPAGWAFQGVTQPVDDAIAAIGEDEFPAPLLTGLTVNGQTYGIPVYSYPQILWYRADWFEEAGIEPPTTWDEVLATAEAFTEGDRYGFITYNRPPEPEILLGLMGANGAATFDADGNVIIDQPGTVEALQFLADLNEFSPPGSMANSETDSRLAFQEGCCAMILSSPSFADVIAGDEEALEQFSATVFPTNTGDRGVLAQWSTLAVTAASEHPEMAKAFLEHWFSEDVYLEFSKRDVIGLLPVVQSVAGSAEYWNSERIAPVAEPLQAAVATDAIGVPMGQTFGPNRCSAQVLSEGIWEEMGDRVTVGGEDPAGVVDWAAAQIQSICEDLG